MGQIHINKLDEHTGVSRQVSMQQRAEVCLSPDELGSSPFGAGRTPSPLPCPPAASRDVFVRMWRPSLHVYRKEEMITAEKQLRLGECIEVAIHAGGYSPARNEANDPSRVSER